MLNTNNGKVYAPHIQNKGARQNARYNNGAEKGWLTASEQAQLQDARAADRATLNAAKSDGVVDHKERAQLRQDMRQTNRELTKFLWNGDVA
ncbi:MAG TPA: hypothetical protein EYO33_11850 [Phycisphaerales bacterium]|nr:hypothetical protein [Phycisphaerales bacterium]